MPDDSKVIVRSAASSTRCARAPNLPVIGARLPVGGVAIGLDVQQLLQPRRMMDRLYSTMWVTDGPLSVILDSLLEPFGAPSRRLIRLRLLPTILHNRAAKL